VPRLVLRHEDGTRSFVVRIILKIVLLRIAVAGRPARAPPFLAPLPYHRPVYHEALGAESAEHQLLVHEIVARTVRKERLRCPLDVIMTTAQSFLGTITRSAGLAEPIDELVNVLRDLVDHPCIRVVLVRMVATAREDLQQARTRGRFWRDGRLENDLEEHVAGWKGHRARIEAGIAARIDDADLGMVNRELRREKMAGVPNDGVLRQIGLEGVAGKVTKMNSRHHFWRKSGLATGVAEQGRRSLGPGLLS
jgi:hypothetical protein